MKKWCKHVVRYGNGLGFKNIIRDMFKSPRIKFVAVNCNWNYCPICGKKRPKEK